MSAGNEMNKGSGSDRQMRAWHPIEDIRSLAGDLRRAVLTENAKGFVVQVEFPDVRKKDLHVTASESAVTIVARWADGLYSRTVPLPATVIADQAQATFRDRVLRIFLPRARPSQVRRIDVK